MRLVKQRGVTLIELAVTVSVLVLLLAAVAPSLGEWVRNTRVRNAATSIQAGLMKARNEALRQNAPVRFSLVSLTDSAVMDNSCALSATAPSWVVSQRDPAGKCATAASDSTDPMIVEKQAGGVGGKTVVVSARLADNSATANSVSFDGFGRVTGVSPIGRIDVNNIVSGGDYRALRIVIGGGGTIRMCEPAVSAADDPRRC